MKFLVTLALVGLVGSVVAKEEFVARIELDYHNAIGIQKAARIKAAEEALDFDGARIGGGDTGGLIITLNTGNTSVCGSSLVTNNRALTAAHCARTRDAQAVNFTVVFGSVRLFSGGTRVNTSDVEVHGDYDMDTLFNDIAILRFEWVAYTNHIRNIDIACGTSQFALKGAWIAGFGLTSDTSNITNKQALRFGKVQVMENADCKAIYGYFVQASNICAATGYGYATCVGDDGGPLIYDGKLLGILSFGYVSSCEAGYPDVYTRVTSFAPWIQARL